MEKAKTILCSQCAKAPAIETQFRISSHVVWGGPLLVWTRCADHVEAGRSADSDHARAYPRDRHFYLPIVQPVMGSEQAVAMELAMHAACRLLRLHDDRSELAIDAARADLALLQATQAEAFERCVWRVRT